jgi:diguanylate cyclase (GGDEF)-like protein
MDPLTGLRNRRAIEEAAARAVRDAVTLRRPLALVMLDLDRFKALNDTWGHALGDRALQTVGTALLQLAGHGCVARLGGEEFAVLLPGASVEEAGRLAEQIRVAVEGLRLSQGAEIASFTTSVGVSSLHPGETEWTALLHRADVALYRAKREGRNRVVLCEEKPSGAAVASGAPETMWRRFIAGRGPLL